MRIWCIIHLKGLKVKTNFAAVAKNLWPYGEREMCVCIKYPEHEYCINAYLCMFATVFMAINSERYFRKEFSAALKRVFATCGKTIWTQFHSARIFCEKFLPSVSFKKYENNVARFCLSRLKNGRTSFYFRWMEKGNS